MSLQKSQIITSCAVRSKGQTYTSPQSKSKLTRTCLSIALRRVHMSIPSSLPFVNSMQVFNDVLLRLINDSFAKCKGPAPKDQPCVSVYAVLYSSSSSSTSSASGSTSGSSTSSFMSRVSTPLSSVAV